MADVFISYSRDDRGRVEKMAHGLEAKGYHVWWDPHIRTGAEFRAEIARELDEARAVIVVWSANSVTSRFVCDEADVGAQREVLVPVLLDFVDIPLGFRQIQTADLSRWRGRTKDAAFGEFLDVVAETVGRPTKRRAQHRAPDPEPTPEPVRQPEPEPQPKVEAQRRTKKKRKEKTPKSSRRKHTITGQRTRMALIFRSLLLAVLTAGAFGVLATYSNFVFEEYRNYLIGALGVLTFVSRYTTFQADRIASAASLHLLSRSQMALVFFAMLASAPLILEARIYAAALEAVRINGIEGADINGITFDSAGTRLVSSSDDGTARVWDAKTGVQISAFNNHKASAGGDEVWVWNAGFNDDGTRAVSASGDLTARVWKVRTGEELAVLSGHKFTVRDAKFSPDGSHIATASSDKTIKLWDSETHEVVRTLTGHTEKVMAVRFNPQGTRLASCSFDGTVRLWNVSNGSTVAVFSTGGANLQDVAFDSTGTRVAAAGENGRAYAWSISSKQRINTFKAPNKLFAVAFINGGGKLATGGLDRIVRIWDTNSGQELQRLEGHRDAVRALSSSADGSLLASSSRDNTARVWDMETGREIQIMGHTTPAIHLPIAIDAPPVIVASRAPTPMDLQGDRKTAMTIAAKGVLIALAALAAGLLLKGILWLVRLRGAARWAVVGVMGATTAYVTLLMLSALPKEAAMLWATLAFVPAALFGILRWFATAAIVRRR